jgi:hypothetical protein
MASVTVPRALNPSTNPAGWMAAAGTVLAAAVMITNAVNHHGVIDTTVIASAVGAVLALFTRTVVTPVADPKDGAGKPLVPATSTVLTYGTAEPVVQVTPNPTGGTVGKP